MKRWVLLFVSSESYIEKTIRSIRLARTTGEWTDDIIILLPDYYNLSDLHKSILDSLSVTIKQVPDKKEFLEFWKNYPNHSTYQYAISRGSIYIKLYAFDIFFKNWDVVFYIDSGSVIQGSLARMKESCEPNNILYAHCDGYPTYEWKLRIQYAFELFTPSQIQEIESRYDLSCNYFQSTIMIFDTNIIQENTVSNLFKLVEQYPISTRGDQGILNLYFNSNKKVWKQIPLADNHGFLYDFHERHGRKRSDYLILKYPMFN